MPILTTLKRYSDDKGNVIEFDGEVTEKIRIEIRGSNNRLIVETPAKLSRLIVRFECDNAIVRIGANQGGPAFGASMRLGQDCMIDIGKNVSVTNNCFISAAEGTSIVIGDDCMIASNNEIRADDSHPIFDVHSGSRVNPSQSISIGAHVWLAKNAIVMGGVTIGEGSVIGYNSLALKDIPNNCVAAGTPARVIRRDVAWERPGLSTRMPFYKPDASTVERSKYWNLTDTRDN